MRGPRSFTRHAHARHAEFYAARARQSVGWAAISLFPFRLSFSIGYFEGLGRRLVEGMMSKSNGKKLHQIFINRQESLERKSSWNFSLKHFFFFNSILPWLWSFKLKFSFLEEG
jgi:hypothetical protein